MNDIPSDADGRLARHEQLSALMDGELDADAACECCDLWREQAEARSNWHLYHVIGDVLRARPDEVSCDAARDARLLRTVRERLAAEPPGQAAVTPPSRPSTALRRMLRGAAPRGAPPPLRRRGWIGGAAAAAVMAAAGFILVTQGLSTPRASDAAATLARAPLQAPPSTLAGASPGSMGRLQVVASDMPLPASGRGAPPSAAEPSDMQLIRDARLDLYLAAHTQFGGSSALGVPSGFLRSSTLQAPGR